MLIFDVFFVINLKKLLNKNIRIAGGSGRYDANVITTLMYVFIHSDFGESGGHTIHPSILDQYVILPCDGQHDITFCPRLT